MADYVSQEILEAVRSLAALVRADKRYEAYMASEPEYEKDAEITRMGTEYNVHQAALSEQFAQKERDEDMIRAIQGRINELYEQITARASYQDYIRAKDESDAFVQMVNAELEAAVTGRAACTHDCASCQAACAREKK